jgi:hypothetical protein
MRADRGDWRATNLEAFTVPHKSKNAQQFRMESCPMAVPRMWRGEDCAGPACATVARNVRQ